MNVSSDIRMHGGNLKGLKNVASTTQKTEKIEMQVEWNCTCLEYANLRVGHPIV